MKNTYVTGYFPFIAILLFSSSLAMSAIPYAIKLLSSFGIYEGMLDYFSTNGIRLALFAAFAIVFFIVFSALKLIAATITELCLLFFSKDPEGVNLKRIRICSSIYLGAGLLSFIFVQFPVGIAGLFMLATLAYFIFVVYVLQSSMSFPSLIGFILFELLFWFLLIIGTIYLAMKLYISVQTNIKV
ncbi:DUF5366 family protein [Bacillus sp. WMMC1349]|uniref:DUF5366 family protein n=1 Tax=Bacillus sp. WMMC1349 TaxID=2736254 RepID=UPI0015581A9A|nr:DUF5366 family protein [Bacillus sp. WMMC1349]NPC93964.1 DUF5366 family protein [Bacillus sp. WMMC1349]